MLMCFFLLYTEPVFDNINNQNNSNNNNSLGYFWWVFTRRTTVHLLNSFTLLYESLHIRFLHAFPALRWYFLLLTLIEQNQGKLQLNAVNTCWNWMCKLSLNWSYQISYQSVFIKMIINITRIFGFFGSREKDNLNLIYTAWFPKLPLEG